MILRLGNSEFAVPLASQFAPRLRVVKSANSDSGVVVRLRRGSRPQLRLVRGGRS